MYLHSFFLYYLLLWQPLGYFLVVLGLALEGEAVLFATAFLTQQGFFKLPGILMAVGIGVLVGDYLWYSLGRQVNSSPSFVRRWMERVASPLDRQISERPFRTIFFTKFAYGIHHAVLVRAGALKLSPERFIKYDLLASTGWVIIIGGLGYSSGVSFFLIRHYLRSAEFMLLVALAGFIILQHFLTKFSKHEL